MKNRIRKAVLATLAILSLLTAIPTLSPISQAEAASTSVRRGDTGSVVKEIQTRLKKWGYYSYDVDGIFGSRTETAVKSFQKKQGLEVDGIVGKQTASKMGISLGSSSSSKPTGGSGGYSENDVYLMARCIYGEARGESYRGKVAVGAVILNRVKSSQFPNTIAGVIYQPRAFSVVADGQINLTPDAECIRAARDAINGVDPTGDCLYYYNPKTAKDPWIRTRKIVVVIGNHAFCI